ncbi:hypothetical protein K439DRAFT_225082 [Ramaria rubella]|nr:hypothetical protein K439DRAFT_225082 [Ramaria rubella]
MVTYYCVDSSRITVYIVCIVILLVPYCFMNLSRISLLSSPIGLLYCVFKEYMEYIVLSRPKATVQMIIGISPCDKGFCAFEKKSIQSK